MLILECSQECYGRTDGSVTISLCNFVGEGIINYHFLPQGLSVIHSNLNKLPFLPSESVGRSNLNKLPFSPSGSVGQSFEFK
jgi:hypothetical protein